MNKRGDTQLIETAIFIVLNILFAVVLLYGISDLSKGAFFYEQVYAKEIALAIDSAKSGTSISISTDRIDGIIKKNDIDLGNIVKIDKNAVIVKLGKLGGYKMNFFSDNFVSVKVENSLIKLTIGEKNE